MIANPNQITVSPTPVTHQTFPTIQPGQIWRDGKRSNPNRLLIVLDASQAKVVCQSLHTGIISKVRKEQFNRGEKGFQYAAEIYDICHKFNHYQKTKLILPPSIPVNKDVGKVPAIKPTTPLTTQTTTTRSVPCFNNLSNNNPS
jgi:hypothetical protein